jgi:hypothetical protein
MAEYPKDHGKLFKDWIVENYRDEIYCMQRGQPAADRV